MKARHFLIGLWLMTSAAALAAAQESPVPGEPAWVEYEQGQLALSRKDYGQAILHYKRALALAKVLPEAELALGDVYYLEGDYPVAENQYLRAFDQRRSFTVPDMQYDALYKLAHLYSTQKRYGKMEEALRTIIKDDPVASSPDQAFFRNNLLKLFNNKGFDAMFLLNRVPESFATTAHAELARYLYACWNFEPALAEALFGVIPLVTEGMLEIRRTNYDYRFTTLADFLRVGLEIEAVRDYLEERSFYQRLYYLALICFEKIPVRDSGIRFLRLLAATDAAGDYQRLAKLQLKKPWRESRIDAPVIEMP